MAAINFEIKNKIIKLLIFIILCTSKMFGMNKSSDQPETLTYLAAKNMVKTFPLLSQEEKSESINRLPRDLYERVANRISGIERYHTFLELKNYECITELSPNGKYIAITDNKGTIKVYDTATYQYAHVLIRPDILDVQNDWLKRVCKIKFINNGTVIISKYNDKKTIVWDLQDSENTGEIKNFFYHLIGISPDMKYMVIGVNNNVQIMSNASKKIKIIGSHTTPIKLVEFSPKGNFIVSKAVDYTTKIWNLEKNDHIKLLKIKLAFSQDEKYIASSADGHKIEIFDTKTLTCIRSEQCHKGLITSVNFSLDGRFLVSTSTDKTIKIFDVKEYINNGTWLLTLSDHESIPLCAKFCQSNRYLTAILVSSDKSIKQVKAWDLWQYLD